MLAANQYPQPYIDACRAQVKTQLATYDKLIAAAKKPGTKDTFDGARAAFEPNFCNGLVLVLDMYFCHRTRAMEGKDGNPCNEVRVLSNSIMTNGGIMLADKTIKMQPESSVLKYEPGDAVQVSKADFARLAEAYFAEIERRFT